MYKGYVVRTDRGTDSGVRRVVEITLHGIGRQPQVPQGLQKGVGIHINQAAKAELIISLQVHTCLDRYIQSLIINGKFGIGFNWWPQFPDSTNNTITTLSLLFLHNNHLPAKMDCNVLSTTQPVIDSTFKFIRYETLTTNMHLLKTSIPRMTK